MVVDFFERALLLLGRDFLVSSASSLIAVLREPTRAASFPAALPIVVAAFIKTPLVFLVATFFFGMVPSYIVSLARQPLARVHTMHGASFPAPEPNLFLSIPNISASTWYAYRPPPVRAGPQEGFMLSVTVWACGCGVRYKAISEVGFIPENKTEVVCSHCGTATQILGIPGDTFEEVAEGQWRAIGSSGHASSSAATSLDERIASHPPK